MLVVGAEEGGDVGAEAEVSCDAFECRSMDDDVGIEEDQNIPVRLDGSAIARTAGPWGPPDSVMSLTPKRRANVAVPSVDPSSTTRISSGFRVEPISAERERSR